MASTDVHVLTTEVVNGPVPVVRAVGELDLGTTAQLCRAIQTTAHRSPRVVVDLVGLEFCDSTGLRGLVGVAREVEVLGGRAVFARVHGGPLDRLLELSGLGEFLHLADSVDEAHRRLDA